MSVDCPFLVRRRCTLCIATRRVQDVGISMMIAQPHCCSHALFSLDINTMDLISQMIVIQNHTLDNDKPSQWHRSTNYLTKASTLSHHCTAAFGDGRVVGC